MLGAAMQLTHDCTAESGARLVQSEQWFAPTPVSMQLKHASMISGSCCGAEKE